MGKLHQLRKAIEADPYAFYTGDEGVPRPCDEAYGAVCKKGKWQPAEWPMFCRKSYEGFIRHVLIELGYMMPTRSARRLLEKRERQAERERLEAMRNPTPLLFPDVIGGAFFRRRSKT